MQNLPQPLAQQYAPSKLHLAGAEADFLSISGVKRCRAGEPVYLEGDQARYCFQVIDGLVKEYATMEDGRRQVSDFYNSGELFGISEEPRNTRTAEAVTDCTLRWYPREAYLGAAAASPAHAKLLFSALMTRLQRARERFVMLSRMSAIGRVCVFLMRLSNEQDTTRNIVLRMSRQDIGDHLGLTIETVCRVLTEMKRRGVITASSARVLSIPDKAMLESLAYGDLSTKH